MRVTTESGSVYEIEDGRVRRLSVWTMRGDGDWVALLRPVRPEVGVSMLLMLEALGEGNLTVRRTSRVTEVTTS